MPNSIPDYENLRHAWKNANLSPLWESATAHKNAAPAERARLWRWSSVRPLIDKAIDHVSTTEVERRALTLANERADGPATSTTRTLNAALQILLPGEAARPHRHTINAIRFVLEGEGAATIVNGKACAMSRGDLILTPGWAWHEHVHRGDKPIIWLDVLDAPLQRFLGGVAFENGPANQMPVSTPDAAFATAIIPDLARSDAQISSPFFRYSYAAAVAAVSACPPSRDGLRRVKYSNPFVGGPAIPLIDCSLVQIDPAVRSEPFRTTSSALCAVIEGSGETRIGDDVISWGPNDIFTVPQSLWVSHVARDTICRLFMASDREVFHRLGLLREEFHA